VGSTLNILLVKVGQRVERRKNLKMEMTK
jgi:hypothetical protein